MNPGAMNQRLIFKQPAEADDEGFGGGDPTVYTKAWGKLTTFKGRTRLLAAQAQMENTREFKIRYQKKLEEGTRPPGLTVQWKGINHEIDSLENEDGLNKYMIVVVKGVSQ